MTRLWSGQRRPSEALAPRICISRQSDEVSLTRFAGNQSFTRVQAHLCESARRLRPDAEFQFHCDLLFTSSPEKRRG